MIIIPYLFIPALTYLPPEYFLLDTICSYILCLYSNPCFLNLISFVVFILVLLLARHLASIFLLAWGVSLTPLDSHVQVMELGASGCPPLLLRVAQR